MRHAQRESVIVGCAPAVDELEDGRAASRCVVVARDPAHARVVSANFERRRAAAFATSSWPRSGCEMVSACATLKPKDLALKAIIAQQDDAANVQKREQIAEQLTPDLSRRSYRLRQSR